MTTVTRNRHWATAFMPETVFRQPGGNSQHGIRVRNFLRDELMIDAGWDEDDNFIHRLESNRGYFNYYDDVQDNDEIYGDWHHVDVVVRYLMNEVFNHATIRALDQKFMSKISGVGEFTKIPFPKEKKHDNSINANNQTAASPSA